MITPGSPPLGDQTTAGTDSSMHRQVGHSYGDLVLPVSGHDLRDLTELPRCGVMQYPTRTFSTLSTQTSAATHPLAD